MSWFARIEERCAALIERAFAQMFPSDLEPAQIARKLVATMEARTEHEGGKLVAPGRYDVQVNASDFERLSPHRAYIENEWRTLLSDMAARVGITLNENPPHVELHASADVSAGAIVIRAKDALAAEQPARATYALHVVDAPPGPPHESVYVVESATRVGRSPDCDIVLADPSVSRNHALLDVRGKALILRDSGSTNGTYLNGSRVTQTEVNAGDVVAFGKTQLRVERAD